MWGAFSPSMSDTLPPETLTLDTAITFLAQWHPLIVPERSDLRPEYNNGPVKGGSFM